MAVSKPSGYRKIKNTLKKREKNEYTRGRRKKWAFNRETSNPQGHWGKTWWGEVVKKGRRNLGVGGG